MKKLKFRQMYCCHKFLYNNGARFMRFKKIYKRAAAVMLSAAMLSAVAVSPAQAAVSEAQPSGKTLFAHNYIFRP